MEFSDLQDLISRLTYKPGYTIECEQYYIHTGEEWWSITLSADLLDATNYKQLVRLTQHRDFLAASFKTHSHIISAILQVIREMEHHEMMEWVRVDGMTLLPEDKLHMLLPINRNIDVSYYENISEFTSL